jgi:hypothetical protein
LGGAQRRPGRRVGRIECEGLLDLLNGAFALMQPGEGIANERVRWRIPWVLFQHALRPRPSGVELAGHQ